ncbi:hypothetical protein SO802_033031 [Lithocarpus litseifolius]|uniref:Uncharacterized protein n=1 Tax=Lithocarpus litseifolius TaxID=425828 RepID=A0AAW2BBV2_9ROSI
MYGANSRMTLAQNDDESSRITEELRRIRVEELKREVQRCDNSIMSLELKLKRLKEERDWSLKEETENVDLKKDLKGDAGEMTPLLENLAVSVSKTRAWNRLVSGKRKRLPNKAVTYKAQRACQERNGVIRAVQVVEEVAAVKSPREGEVVATRVQYSDLLCRCVGASISKRRKGVTFTTSWYWRHC